MEADGDQVPIGNAEAAMATSRTQPHRLPTDDARSAVSRPTRGPRKARRHTQARTTVLHHQPRAAHPAMPARSAAQHASHMREARTQAGRAIYCGTLNTRNLGTQEGLCRLTAISQMMDPKARDIAVLAVQETKLLRHKNDVEQAGLHYFGSYAERSGRGSTGGSRTGGTGFLVRADARQFFTYLSMRPRCNHVSETRKYAAHWGHLYGTSKENDIYIASVYMPDTTVRQEVFDQALQDLGADIAHFSTKPGSIVLAGDFNARVGHQGFATLPQHLREVAPCFGEDAINTHGRKLLQFCAEHGLTFLSGVRAGSTGPTCTGHGRNQTSGATGTSIVDHVIGSRSLARSSASPPHCYSMWGDYYKEDLEDIASDHVPVVLRCSSCTAKPQSSENRSHRWAWRLERLRDAEILEQYTAKVAERAAASPWMQTTAAHRPQRKDQQTCDDALSHCVGIFEAAAEATIGRRCIRPGYTLRDMNASCKAYVDDRLAAHREFAKCPSAANTLAFTEARDAARLALRRHRRAQQRTAAQACIGAWERAPGSRGAHKALKRLTGARDNSDIDALQHPATQELCFDDDSKADAFRVFYADLFASRPPQHPSAQAQAAESRASVAQERLAVDDGPECLSRTVSVAEVQATLKRMQNHRAPGTDKVPVELFKYAGDAGAQALCKLFNTVLATECCPTAWRQGMIISAYKAGDPTDCGNYRGLTLLTAADKVWAALVARRVGNHITLHDHQYGFRPKRGTMNALFNLSTIVRTRKTAGEGTYVFFLDAKKAFDTVPHHSLLARLRAKGVTGKMWRVIDSMYRSASSTVRLGAAMSQPVRIERGVAQGCPLSPLLYAIFADSLLEAVQTDTGEEGITVHGQQGLDACHLTGQSYADDMAAIATTAAGLQRIIDRVRAHSQEWEWEANTKKSTTMVFGNPDILQREEGTRWHWGEVELSRVQTMKYLGLHFHESGSWATQVDMAAAKGHQAFMQWIPVLVSPVLPVTLKRKVIATRIVPVLTYGMEVWSPEQAARRGAVSLRPISDVIDKACRVAAGIHATKGTKAWQKRPCVSKEVLQSDFQLLPLSIQLDLAHARYSAQADANDSLVFSQASQHEDLSQLAAASAYQAPDRMGALLRANLQESDPWVRRSRKLRPSQPDARTPLKDLANQAAMAWRLRTAAAAPTVAPVSGRGRERRDIRQADPHVNPVPSVLQQQHPALYLHGASAAVWPIMAMRSACLPGTCSQHARCTFAGEDCPTCHTTVIPVDVELTDTERRWRHICHQLFACDAVAYAYADSAWAPLLSFLGAARHEALRHNCLDLANALKIELDINGGFTPMYDTVMPLLLDPAERCKQFQADPQLTVCMQKLVAAFSLYAGAAVGATEVDELHIRALNLPHDSGLHLRVFPSDGPSPILSSDDTSTESEDELVPPWVRQTSPCPGHEPMSEPGRPSVSNAQRHINDAPHTQPAYTQSGPSGLHEVDAPDG